ncbi:hypothetical protein VKT23_009289 [Stygiomarasmius scandens]|uniref:F-box domain-containing protein n=1 Tax=Marasmiellus scandens TaxID=2682957 RepID=A0ABR1JHP5_9AGAR
MDDLPAEIFARIFEIGVHQWGIGFLPPLCLTCRGWYSVIETTPRLWGILVLRKKMDLQTFQSHMRKAKSSPLSVTVLPRSSRIFDRSGLLALTANWVYASVPLSILKQTTWGQLSALQTLVLMGDTDPASDPKTVDSFFETTSTSSDTPKLKSLTVDNVSTLWIRRMLSPQISHFQMTRRTELPMRWWWMTVRERPCYRLSETLGCLSSIPNVDAVSLANIDHCQCHPYNGALVRLDLLTVLQLNMVSNFPVIMVNIQAPALQSLSITSSTATSHSSADYYHSWQVHYISTNGSSDNTPISAAFAEWSRSDSIPSQLTNLELYHCLRKEDMPYLIFWLRCLPKLARLSVGLDEDILDSGLSKDYDILWSLSVPYHVEDIAERPVSWLCPSLIQLCIEGEVRVADLLSLAKARNVGSNADLGQCPGKLRRICASLCFSGSEEEIAELRCIVEDVDIKVFVT